MKRPRGLPTFCAILVLTLNSALAAGPETSRAIELPQTDRKALERQLGQGVVGAALPGKPLPDTSKLLPIRDTTWTYRFVSGDQQGTTQPIDFAPLKRDSSGATGRFSVGTKTVYFVRQSDNGDLSVVSEQDLGEGVIVRYGPPEPMILSGMNPGESRTMNVGVKVYDLGDPAI